MKVIRKNRTIFLDILGFLFNTPDNSEFLITKDDVDYSKHAGVISYFQREYIKTQKFEKKYSKYLSQAFQIRNNTDYADFFVVSFEDAREQADRAKEFLTAIEEFLKAEDIGENKY